MMTQIILETRCKCRRIALVHHDDYEKGRTMIALKDGEGQKIESVHLPHVMVWGRAFEWRGAVDSDFCLRVFEECL
jgi:hypothetical protein